MKQRIRSDIIDLRLKAKRAGAYPCEMGCPFGADCEICCYLFPALFDNHMKRMIYPCSYIHQECGMCPCSCLGEYLVSRRIDLFMEEGR